MDRRSDEIVKIAEDYAAELSKNMDVKEVWIFGSRVRGDNTESSDLDIAVVSPEYDRSFRLANRKAQRALCNLNTVYDIEIHGFGVRDFVEEDALVVEIKRTGIRIQ